MSCQLLKYINFYPHSIFNHRTCTCISLLLDSLSPRIVVVRYLFHLIFIYFLICDLKCILKIQKSDSICSKKSKSLMSLNWNTHRVTKILNVLLFWEETDRQECYKVWRIWDWPHGPYTRYFLLYLRNKKKIH